MRTDVGNELYRSLDDTKPAGHFDVSKEQEPNFGMFARIIAKETIVQACKDYKDALTKDNASEIIKLEKFFKSELFEMYAGLQSNGGHTTYDHDVEIDQTMNGEYLMRAIRQSI